MTTVDSELVWQHQLARLLKKLGILVELAIKVVEKELENDN